MVPEIVKAVVQHYTLDDIQTFFERQEKRTEVKTDRAEIMIFGPFIIELIREVQINLQVRIDLTLTTTRNKYKWAEISERYVQQAQVPLKVEGVEGSFDAFCLERKGLRVLYHGGVEFLEFGTIEIAYQHVGDMI